MSTLDPSTQPSESDPKRLKKIASSTSISILRWRRKVKNILVWLGKRFYIREAKIPPDIREICEGYHEDAVVAVLAGGFSPNAKGLVALNQNEETREYARLWLVETYDKKERRDWWALALEIAVVALIIWEIRQGYIRQRQDTDQFSQQQNQTKGNFDKQQSVLGAMQSNTEKTSESLKTVTDEQSSMITALRNQLKTQQEFLHRTEESNVVFSEQLKILKTEQEERIAEQNRKPKLETWVHVFIPAGYTPAGFKMVKVEKETQIAVFRNSQNPELVSIKFFLVNTGNTPAMNVVFSPKVASNISILCLTQRSLYLSADAPSKPCETPFGQIAPIQPWPKGKSTDLSLYPDVPLYFDEIATINIHTRVPIGATEFIIELQISADRAIPIFYRLRCFVGRV